MRRTQLFLSKQHKGASQYPLCAFLLLLLFGAIPQVFAQNDFNSGSTGADGAFAPTSNQTFQLPESGIFNFTTVNIPNGVTVSFTNNTKNTPVTILATGNVTISGSIVVNGGNALGNGVGGIGGPAGAKGGTGGLLIDTFAGTTGDGRGGGAGGNSDNGANISGGGGGGFGVTGSNGASATAPYGIGGAIYGTSSLLPLMGGSGGGGGGTGSGGWKGTGGGGGGGAILIASSGTVTISGLISARGGNGLGADAGGTGGGGSGGAVRLIANTITGTGAIDVRGGTGGSITYSQGRAGGAGGRGHVKAEAYDYSTFNPNVYGTPVNITMPNPIFPPNNSQIRISSIAGVSVPLSAKGSFYGAPDIALPSSLPNPVTVQIEASQIPLETIVQVLVTAPSGAKTIFQSTALSGTTTFSTATASITLPSGMSVITASLTVNLQLAKLMPVYINGEKINSIEIASNLGGQSETTYITKSGKRLKFPVINR